MAVPFVGLTGGLGAGKSAALTACGRLGCATLSTDAVVHQLYARADVRNAVVERFGETVAPGEVIDRSEVARRAFTNDEDRLWLEQQLWPRVGERLVEWREQVLAMDPPPPAAVVEVPLLFESGMERAFDATIAITAPEELRAERAAERGHVALDERAARQLPQEEKAARATYVIVNDGSEEDLERALSDVIGKLRM